MEKHCDKCGKVIDEKCKPVTLTMKKKGEERQLVFDTWACSIAWVSAFSDVLDEILTVQVKTS